MEPSRPDPSEPLAPSFDTGPGPPRGAFLIAYAGVVLAGLLGGALGYAVVDATTRGGASGSAVVGALVGAVVAAVGTGVVAVLALRAMAEWRRPRS